DQAWVIACNQVGLQRGVHLGGHSAVIDPTGDVVSRASTGETILLASVAPDAVKQWRSEFPALGDIVPF
ncbi:MAG: carbon-nitrogen family hydrolase, partial [Actinomycetia bacterium]|nr:carbon-nitrogen family hydrolase [Actinomycetes bacterium]